MNTNPITQNALSQGPHTMSRRVRVAQLWKRFHSVGTGLVSLVDQAVVSATSFATAVIINRACSQDEVGLYYLSLSLVLVAIGVHERLIAAPYTIYSRRFREPERAAYAGSAWVHHATLTVLAIAILVLAIAGLTVTAPATLLPALWALLGAGPLLLLREWIRRFAFADLDFTTALVIDLVVAIAQLGGLLVVAYFGRLTIFNIYVVMGMACGLASLGWYALRPPQVRFERPRMMKDWKSNWSFGRWALRSYLVHNIVPYAMVWIVGAATGTVGAGLLGACTTLIGLTTLLLTGVDRWLTPRAASAFFEGGSSELKGVLLRAGAFLLTSLAPFCLFVFLTGPWLAVFVYGKGYEQSGPILATLAAASMTTSLEMVAGIGLWSVDRPRANFLADLCSVSVTISSAVLLVPLLGAWGAALATLSGSATAAVVRSITLFYVLDSSSLSPHLPNEASTCR